MSFTVISSDDRSVCMAVVRNIHLQLLFTLFTVHTREKKRREEERTLKRAKLSIEVFY